MTEAEKIEAVAVAMAVTRGGSPNSTDNDFAQRFVVAWQRMKIIDAATGPQPQGATSPSIKS